MVGSGDQARIESLARRLDVEDRIRFFGPRTDGERFYGAADVFCLPSLYEAFPLVGLEAAAAGLPLVATRVSGIEDLVVHGESGLLVERTDEAVGDALIRLSADSKLQRARWVKKPVDGLRFIRGSDRSMPSCTFTTNCSATVSWNPREHESSGSPSLGRPFQAHWRA